MVLKWDFVSLGLLRWYGRGLSLSFLRVTDPRFLFLSISLPLFRWFYKGAEIEGGMGDDGYVRKIIDLSPIDDRYSSTSEVHDYHSRFNMVPFDFSISSLS